MKSEHDMNLPVDIDKDITIKLKPELIFDSIHAVDTMVEYNVKLIETVRDLCKFYIANGVPEKDAVSVVLEFHKRAGEKASKLVRHDDMQHKPKSSEGNEEFKLDHN